MLQGFVRWTRVPKRVYDSYIRFLEARDVEVGLYGDWHEKFVVIPIYKIFNEEEESAFAGFAAVGRRREGRYYLNLDYCDVILNANFEYEGLVPYGLSRPQPAYGNLLPSVTFEEYVDELGLDNA